VQRSREGGIKKEQELKPNGMKKKRWYLLVLSAYH